MVVINYRHRGAEIEQLNTTDSKGNTMCVILFEFMVVINYRHRGAEIEQLNTTDSKGKTALPIFNT